MKITVSLATDESLALRRVAAAFGDDLSITAQIALRDWLIGHGYLELQHEMDEDTETAGEA